MVENLFSINSWFVYDSYMQRHMDMGFSNVLIPIIFFIPWVAMAFPPGKLPMGFTSNYTDVTAIHDYLNAHNQARAQVGVGPIKWSDKVAAYAQNYAAQRANDCKLQLSGGPYGENIAEASWNFSPTEAVKMWVDEKPFYDYGSNKCVGGHDCLHYTQVVWRKSVNLGCAKVQCKNNKWFFVICNYDPPGNFKGERPY